MKKDQYFLYTDVSYAHLEQFGVAGYTLFTDSAQHQKETREAKDVKTSIFKEKNNARAEIISAMKALSEVPKGVDLQLYADCETLTNLLARREKLETNNYISDRNKKPVENTELYKEFFALYDTLKPTIHLVKGHAPDEKDDLHQAHFRVVAKTVRKQMQFLVKKDKKP